MDRLASSLFYAEPMVRGAKHTHREINKQIEQKETGKTLKTKECSQRHCRNTATDLSPAISSIAESPVQPSKIPTA